MLPSRKINDRHVPIGRGRDLEKLRGLETQGGREQIGREDLLRGVEAGRDVVVELAREADLVLRSRQLFLQQLDVLVRLERRVVLGDGEQPSERLRQLPFLLRGVGGPGGGERFRAERRSAASR